MPKTTLKHKANALFIPGQIFERMTVNGIVISPDMKVLMLKRSEHEDTNQLKWSLPGGGVDEFDTPRGTMIREFSEETGRLVGKFKTFSSNHKKDGSKGYKYFIAAVTKTFEPELIPEEHCDYAWVPLEEVLQMPDLHDRVERLFKKSGIESIRQKAESLKAQKPSKEKAAELVAA